MRNNKTRFRTIDATQRYKTALGRALVYNLEQGITWRLDARGRLEPIARNFVEPVAGKDVESARSESRLITTIRPGGGMDTQ